MNDIKQNIINYLNNHQQMTIATSGGNKPSAATVVYVTDGVNIYFGTNKKSQKAINVANNPLVAITIDEEYDNWKQIQGVQVEGMASIVTDAQEAEKIGQLFGQEFPQMADIPVTEDSVFVKIEPKTGYFIDYTKGFAHRDTIDFAA